MAISISMISDTGTQYNGAYTKIDEYSCNKQNVINARIRSYASKEMEREGKLPIEGSENVISIQGDYSEGAKNPKQQIYDYMKTLPEYKNGIDILE